MTERDVIIRSLAEYLNVAGFADYCINGIQVEGSERVSSIVVGVSVSAGLIHSAIERGAEMVIVHHGLFWKSFSSPIAITGVMRDRLKLLLRHDITLAAYHLPLDAHPVVGNNARILKLLGFPPGEAFDVGFLTALAEPIETADLKRRLDGILIDPGKLYGNLCRPIRSIAVISGGGSHFAEKAAAAGADALITGEVSEPSVRTADELGICLVRTGHYNSERFGPQALAEYIGSTFDVRADFIDIPNDV